MKGINKKFVKFLMLVLIQLTLIVNSFSNAPAHHIFLQKETLQSFYWEFYSNLSNNIKVRGNQYSIQCFV